MSLSRLCDQCSERNRLVSPVEREHNRSGPFDLFSRIQKPKVALWFGVVGALSFWVPDVIVHVAARRTFDSLHVWLMTFLMPATFLFAYLVARRFVAMHDFKWVGAAMLLGVWVTGGLFMMLAATASGGGFANPEGIRGSLWIIALSIIPLVTYMLATYDGSLFALLAVTVGALLIWGVHSRGILLPFQRRPR